jgi:multiple sugar transport system substrate-binding protein
MLKKAIFNFTIIIVFIVPFLSLSCQGDEDDRIDKSEINLLLNRHPFTESILRFLPEFEKKYNIKIKILLLSEEEYFEKLITELSSKTGFYDVFMVGFPHIWQYSKAGWLEPLDRYIADTTLTSSNWDFEDFYPILIESSRWNQKPGVGLGEGPLWAIPVNEEAYIIFYRKDLFERFNVKIPTTYQEVYEAAKALTRKVDGQQIYGFAHRGVRSWSTIHPGYSTAFYTCGASDFDAELNCTINSPQGIEITDLFIRILKETGPPGWPSYTWYEGKEGFLSGKFAMWFDANHQAAAFEDRSKSHVAGKVGYLLPPPGKDGAIRSNTWLWSLAMNAFSKQKEKAWQFLAWATSKEILLRTVPYENINPTRQSVWNDPKTVEITNWANGEYRRTAEDLLLRYAKIRWTPNVYATEIGDRWAEALQEIYTGSKNTEAALNDAAEDINNIMNNN